MVSLKLRGDVPGVVARNRLLTALAEVCAAHPVDEKILVAPSLSSGVQILDALARSGTAHVNLRPATIRSLALALVGPELAKEGIRLLSRAQALALVEEASDDALATGSYFADLRTRPGLNRALLATLGELERAGLPAEDLPPEAFEDRRKAGELVSVRRALRRLLERNAFATPDDVLALALGRARKGRHPLGAAFLLLPENLELSPAQAELVSRLAGAREIPLAVDPPDFAFAPRATILAATGEENEVRALLRRILSTGMPFDQVEVTATDGATYGPLLFELLEEHGVPATFQDGLPASAARPGRAALAFIEWTSEGFPARVLATALSDGLIELASVRPAGSRAGSRRLAGLLLRARVFLGRGRYLPRLAALRSPGEPEPDGKEPNRPAETAVLFDLVKKLLDLAPASEAPSLPTLARATGTFLATFARISAARDGIVRDALLGLCGELSGLPERPLAAGEAAARLSEAVRELAVGGTTPLPGRVHVAPLESAGLTGRPLLWVLGLDEARFPGAPRQDPVLLDHERERINTLLPHAKLSRRGADAAGRARRTLLSALARTRGEVVLSFSERDLLEDADRFPSAFLLEVFRAKTGRPDADYAALRGAIGRPEGFVPDSARALDDGEWWLASLHEGSCEPAAHLPDVCRIYPWLAEAARAEAARAGTAFTPWDGRVSVSGGDLDPRAGGPIVSASRLERLAACPRAYFFGDVLRLSAPEEERPAGVWLQPYEFGNLLHEVFHDFLAALSARRERPRSSALPELKVVAERHLGKWRDRVPPPTEASFAAQREELLAACAILLAGEEREEGRARPRFFEVPFGMSGEEPGEAGSVEPIEVDVGSGRFRLRGRIDRIDEGGRGRWSVWDYKSGSQRRFRDETALDKGRRLQHVLYARAAEALLRSRGEEVGAIESGYIFPTRRGTGWRFVPPPLPPARVDAVLNDLLDLPATGTFVHSPDEEDCQYCDFRDICGDVAKTARRAAHKLADEANESLQPFRILRDSRD